VSHLTPTVSVVFDFIWSYRFPQGLAGIGWIWASNGKFLLADGLATFWRAKA
jgi:hypothetical protein